MKKNTTKKKDDGKMIVVPIPEGYYPDIFEFRGKDLYIWCRKSKKLHAIAFKL